MITIGEAEAIVKQEEPATDEQIHSMREFLNGIEDHKIVHRIIRGPKFGRWLRINCVRIKELFVKPKEAA